MRSAKIITLPAVRETSLFSRLVQVSFSALTYLYFEYRVLVGSTYVANDRYFSHAVQDIKPDSNVLRSVGNRSSHFTHELVRVNSNLEDVVGEREEWGQWKCSHEDGNEAKLENCEVKINITGINYLFSFCK